MEDGGLGDGLLKVSAGLSAGIVDIQRVLQDLTASSR